MSMSLRSLQQLTTLAGNSTLEALLAHSEGSAPTPSCNVPVFEEWALTRSTTRTPELVVREVAAVGSAPTGTASSANMV
ncbi:hypothetical protein TcWFU_008225 [Taenia crassiceps]|uniref:Uncharacterized protein n=1 Tax=Taenia crassiceps TaxID=6207 RepID=A0ABR4QC41_9CEST